MLRLFLRVAIAAWPGIVAVRHKRMYLAADVTDRVVLRRRRLLHDQVPFGIPGHVVGAGPSMSRPEPGAILDGNVGHDVVEQSAHRPAMVGFARGKLVDRVAIEKRV